MVHCWDDVGDGCSCVLCKEQCCFFINLCYNEYDTFQKHKNQHTFNIQMRSDIIVQSSSSSSYFWSLRTLLAVMSSIIKQYSNAILSMSNVEFHWVFTLRRISQTWSDWEMQASHHAGRRLEESFCRQLYCMVEATDAIDLIKGIWKSMEECGLLVIWCSVITIEHKYLLPVRIVTETIEMVEHTFFSSPWVISMFWNSLARVFPECDYEIN